MPPFLPRTSLRRSALLLTCALALAPMTTASLAASPGLMPWPAELQLAEGKLPVSPAFSVALAGADDGRLAPAVDRMLQAWSVRTGTPFRQQKIAVAAAALVIDCAAAGPAVPRLGEDESYSLEISTQQAVLRAPTTTGALRGLATLTQLLITDGGFALPAVAIRDQPRFVWRGLLIDVSRHWMPAEVIRRELDGMALVKFNVLHLHLTDDQGFRIESRTHPELHRLGSDGNFFTQDQMRELIAYARARGIRVVPEFDIPGHSTSWVVSHPELASAPGPYQICRRWGVENPVLDPTNEALYPLLDDFLGEMSALFPDEFLHIGGDENNGVQWAANAHILNFIRTHGLKDNAGLHTWFNRRLATILQRHHKRLIGWDEILHPDLPAGSVIHSWRGPMGVTEAAQAGHPVILSNGYYIDLYHPAIEHYTVDPLPADTKLTPAQQALVLGGEATMWAEWVNPEVLDSRIWPRSAGIAERLWSPRTLSDPAELYRRLPIIHARLLEAGLNPTRWPRIELPGVDSQGPLAQSLLALSAAVEPVKYYQRGKLQPDVIQTSALHELADWALPESRRAREFKAALEGWLLADAPLAANPASTALLAQLAAWQSVGELAATAPAGTEPRAQDRVRVAGSLRDLSRTGREAIAFLISGTPAPSAWQDAAHRTLEAAKPNAAAVEFPFLPSLRLLVAAAADPALRDRLPRAEWRARLAPATPAS